MELQEGGVLGNGNITCKWPEAGTTWHTPGMKASVATAQAEKNRMGMGGGGSGTAGKGPDKVRLGQEVWILL